MEVVLTNSEWNESLNAIKGLRHFAQIHRNEKSREHIAQGIDPISKNIRKKRATQKPKTQEEKIDITTNVNNLSSSGIENILGQIVNESKGNYKNCKNNKILEEDLALMNFTKYMVYCRL